MIINTIVSIWLQKYARIFVLGHNLFPEAQIIFRGIDNFRGQISAHIFAPNGDYCLFIYSVSRLPIKMIAELQHSRASGAPWVRIFGKPMRPRKFGAYASTPSRTDSQGGGVESQGDPTGGGGGID